ncbi:hypothetical protein G5V57_26230 [Nordella sp. HKS 07]|uniref:hypothetical protein n=1 Tax=Nordella sp. HKS 07 TaxID=2712222 RepID=UPI0013E17066|nr:hypothetical protein [Nordella sp. HKS 07]QIG50920.1 hypothetical protein G5V57_26230 [Nordella sp. HKS 07]
MKSYQLHSADDRHAVFAQLSPRIWLENDLLRAWVVTDPEVILRIFRSPLAVVSSLTDVLKAIRENYGTELPNVAYACGVLPLLVADEAHPAARKGFATFLAARLSELDAELADLSKACLAPLGRKGHVDLVSEVVDPFIHRVFSVFLQCDLPPEFLSMHVGDILSFNTNLARLKNLEGRIAKTLAFLRETTPNDDDIAWKFTCLVFGLDSLAMMLTEGIVAALRDDPVGSAGTRLPIFPIETGVPVTFRRAKADFDMDGCAFKAGDLIRLQLQSFGYSRAAEHSKFIFGAGMHSCVGKQLSLRIWESFKRDFDALDLRARMANYQLMPSHFIILHKLVEVEVQ